jgi:methylmalonyl-CoA mutase C-terminal domain/subunit
MTHQVAIAWSSSGIWTCAVTHGRRQRTRGVRRRFGLGGRALSHAPGSAARRLAYNPRMADRPLKVLIAKPGLDGHDRGAKVLARGLRDEGFEVVYTGLRQTPEMIATAALQEDVDVVGLSILSGAHMTLVPRVTALLRDRGMDDVLVTVGGIIPDVDIPALREAGVAEIFGPGTTIAQVATFLRANAHSRD